MESHEYTAMDAIENTHWWFVAKRLFVQVALERTGIKKMTRKDVLDIGCGTGAVMDFFRQQGATVSGVDMSSEAIAYCEKKGFAPKLGEAHALPFDDNSFDIAVALDVFEHVEDDKGAVVEMLRVLKSGGVGVITVPAHMWLWSYHDVSLHHVRRYSKKTFSNVLQGLGADVTITPIHMSILLPLSLVRFVNRYILHKDGESGSDVRQTSALINIGMRCVYGVELCIFRVFGRLPFGSSFLAIVQKHDT